MKRIIWGSGAGAILLAGVACAAVSGATILTFGMSKAEAQHSGPMIMVTHERDAFTRTERDVLREWLGQGDTRRSEAKRGGGRRGDERASRGGGPPRHAGPPGHARRDGGLPPGIARKFSRGDSLPPGIAKQYLPREAQRRLPERDTYEIYIVDRDAYLVSLATNVIVDILRGH